MISIPAPLVEQLYRESRADRWALATERFAAALQVSVDRGAPGDVVRYLRGLHLQDLALACACADGIECAWDHFILEHRPALYRAADTLDPSGSVREIADAIYGELYGVARTGETSDQSRKSLFRYYHGRSSLKTWLRAVLAQRHVDAIRTSRRFDPLPEGEQVHTAATTVPAIDPDPDRARFRALIQRAFKVTLSQLSDRDRLRLASYYSHELTLAETGRILKEHEATVSRQLARTRQMLRREVERHLREVDRLDPSQIERCFQYVLEDPGPMDLGILLRKNSAPDRSI